MNHGGHLIFRHASCLPAATWCLLVALGLGVGGASLAGAQEPDFTDEFPFREELEESVAATPQVATPPSDSAFPPDDGRGSFDLLVPADKGGGRIVAAFRSASSQGATNTLTGEVEIRYQDMRVLADRLVYDSETGDISAEGNVVLDQGPRRFSAAGMEFNIETELGVFYEVVGYVADEYTFTGRRVEKTGESSYVVEDGTFTSCVGVTPPWSFKTRRLKFTVDGYAKARGATFRVKKAPLIYFPYILWPVRSARTSGLLIPKPGYSSRRGPSLGLAYYQTLGRSWDTTFELDFFTGGAPAGSLGEGDYLGVGNELRYRPSEGTSGRFEGYAIRDPELDDWRWRVQWDHRSESLPGGWRGVLSFEDVSDFDYFLDFERRGDRNSRRQLHSSAFLSKNQGPHSFNILADTQRTFVGRDAATGEVREIELSQLPELEYKLRSTRLGKTPLYLAMRGSAHYLDVDRDERQQASYGRADLSPELTLPVRLWPWLSMSVSAGGRFTHWQDSLYTREELADLAEPSTSDFRGDSLSRSAPTAGAEIVGPSFSRIFEGGGGRYARFKHVVEPRFTYEYFDTFDEEERIPIFDEVDNLRGSNLGRIALVNRLLAKEGEGEGSEDPGAAKEILAFELFRFVSFDDERPLQRSADRTQTTQEGPLGFLFRYNPSRRTTVRTEVSYNTLFSALEDASLSATLGIGRNDSLGVRWTARRDPENDTTRSHQVRVSSQLSLIPRRLNLSAQLTYDVEEQLFQHQRYFFDYQGSCYRLSLELSELRNGELRDQEYRFLVTLKNVGTFLDFSGGESERF
jgi:LPS-assembly protein